MVYAPKKYIDSEDDELSKVFTNLDLNGQFINNNNINLHFLYIQTGL